MIEKVTFQLSEVYYAAKAFCVGFLKAFGVIEPNVVQPRVVLSVNELYSEREKMLKNIDRYDPNYPDYYDRLARVVEIDEILKEIRMESVK